VDVQVARWRVFDAAAIAPSPVELVAFIVAVLIIGTLVSVAMDRE